MKASDLLKDKNKLLMGIPIILGMLFIYVFFIHAGQSEDCLLYTSPSPRDS